MNGHLKIFILMLAIFAAGYFAGVYIPYSVPQKSIANNSYSEQVVPIEQGIPIDYAAVPAPEARPWGSVVDVGTNELTLVQEEQPLYVRVDEDTAIVLQEPAILRNGEWVVVDLADFFAGSTAQNSEISEGNFEVREINVPFGEIRIGDSIVFEFGATGESNEYMATKIIIGWPRP